MNALDIEDSQQLRDFLEQTGRIGRGETLSICLLPGGVSHRTVRVERASGEQWVLKQPLSKLRVPGDWYSSPERVHREALALRWMPQLVGANAAPELVFDDAEQHVIGMRAVAEPHRNWKQLLLSGRLDPEHVAQSARLLATLHRQASVRREEIEPLFADRRFFETLRLEPYYEFAAQQLPAAASFLRAVTAETRGRADTLVHGDYSPKNILVQAGRLVLLDYEVSHFGDPTFDSGFLLTHFLSKAHYLSAHREQFADAARAWWATYQGHLGEPDWSSGLESAAVRQTLACLLARVVGRSPLEYLGPRAGARQQAAVLALIEQPPTTVSDLVDSFLMQIHEHPSD